MRFVVGVVVLVGCMTPVMQFGEGKSAKQAQRETMADHTPGRLVVNEKWSGEVVTKKIRVWVDNQYRTQNIKWQQTFDGTLELANLVLEPLFGLRLAADYRVWERHVPGSTLTDDIAALAAHDPGTDGVFAVVGLTTALPLVSATFDDLGMAAIGGRHLVVRGYADAEERKLYADVFRDLMPEERELALEQRRQHKTAVVLLHELGHCLGVDHDSEDNVIMSASYSHRASKFSQRARDIMRKGIDARIGRAGATPEPTPAAIKTTTRAPLKGPLVFHITPEGDVKRDDKKLDDVDLDNLLFEAAAQSKDTEVIIKRAKKAPAAALERIVTRATANGLAKVTIAPY